MNRLSQPSVKVPPNLIQTGSFSLERLVSHVDAGSAEECEAFVHTIYEQRRSDRSSDRDDKTGR